MPARDLGEYCDSLRNSNCIWNGKWNKKGTKTNSQGAKTWKNCAKERESITETVAIVEKIVKNEKVEQMEQKRCGTVKQCGTQKQIRR